MTYLILIWLLCAAGTCWLKVMAGKGLTVEDVTGMVIWGPVMLFIGLFVWGEDIVLWRAKR